MSVLTALALRPAPDQVHAGVLHILGAEPGWKCFFAGAEELLQEIQQSQAQLVEWQAEKTEAELAKQQLDAALEETRMANKRSRPSHNIQQASEEEQLEHKLQASLHSGATCC